MKLMISTGARPRGASGSCRTARSRWAGPTRSGSSERGRFWGWGVTKPRRCSTRWMVESAGTVDPLWIRCHWIVEPRRRDRGRSAPFATPRCRLRSRRGAIGRHWTRVWAPGPRRHPLGRGRRGAAPRTSNARWPPPRPERSGPRQHGVTHMWPDPRDHLRTVVPEILTHRVPETMEPQTFTSTRKPRSEGQSGIPKDQILRRVFTCLRVIHLTGPSLVRPAATDGPPADDPGSGDDPDSPVGEERNFLCLRIERPALGSAPDSGRRRARAAGRRAALGCAIGVG